MNTCDILSIAFRVALWASRQLYANTVNKARPAIVTACMFVLCQIKIPGQATLAHAGLSGTLGRQAEALVYLTKSGNYLGNIGTCILIMT